MLNQPMMEKLLAMRWHGMVEALKAQEQDRAANELSFLERLALLVDQQWSWRENQALARRLKAAKLRGATCVEDIDYRAARGLDKTVVRALVIESAWVRNHENIFVIGPCGVGKSFLAAALAQKACRDSKVSAVHGAQTRMRAILMTSMAMIAGMIPMALGLGEGGQQTAPLGRAVIGGLLFATAATLLVVPLVFSRVLMLV